ncbi:hypothetical protein E2C01_005734 [Portunus trituberculatus]|uniref:Uncharacterized protein n=1 Tax=Portunus trituberculatus TaxID=210409 RepID=A0A5B7CXE2_PORTR|nr:hypothetical protein [Portunus trituberculatus]
MEGEGLLDTASTLPGETIAGVRRGKSAALPHNSGVRKSRTSATGSYIWPGVGRLTAPGYFLTRKLPSTHPPPRPFPPAQSKDVHGGNLEWWTNGDMWLRMKGCDEWIES